MQRLSLADLTAKSAVKTITKAEVFTGGEDKCDCHLCTTNKPLGDFIDSPLPGTPKKM